MPTVGCVRDDLMAALGKEYTEKEFDELCFEFGIELDEVTSEAVMERKEKGSAGKITETASEALIYKLDIPANRYDLLCIEGVARALRVFLGKEAVPVYRTLTPDTLITMTVSPETALIRPYVVAAVLRNVKFTTASYNSFIDLQDKFHENICRKRTLVAIGTHDLDSLQPPFLYEALPPKDISFTPLNQTEDQRADIMFENFEHDAKIKKFLPIIRDSPVYPLIMDSKRTVCSLPPIINSDHSKISLETKNVFIECTATDVTKANIVLNQMVAMFSQYCGEAVGDASQKFTVEPVKVIYPEPEGRSLVEKEVMCPDMSHYNQECEVDYINSATGIKPPLSGDQMCELLTKMQLTATVKPDGKTLVVSVPPTRSDVLQACDVMEDVAIAYGYDNIEKTVPNTNTVGVQYPVNKLTDLLRYEFASCGFTEVLTLALCSMKENFDYLRRKNEPPIAVEIANPKTIGFEICRTSLLPGLFKTVQSSGKKIPLPLKLFEVSDIVLLDAEAEVDGTRVGAVNQRNMAAIMVNTTDSFEVIHGVVDRMLQLFEVKKGDYTIEESDDPTYLPRRSAQVVMKGVVLGTFGVVHPEVLQAFNFADKGPASAMELNVDMLLKLK